MAFEKTELTQEEQDYIKNLNIKTFSRKIDEMIKPTHAVLDREKKIYLFLVTDENWEYRNHVVFIFIWKDSPVVIRYALEPCDYKEYHKHIGIRKEVRDDYIEIVDSINQALLLYKQNCSKIIYPLENYTVFSLGF